MSVTYSAKNSNRMTTAQIQKVLEENCQLILTIQDCQMNGKVQDTTPWKQRLYQNLISLANAAESNQSLHVLIPPPPPVNAVAQHQSHPVQMNEQQPPTNYNPQMNVSNQPVAPYRNMAPMIHRPSVNPGYNQRPYQPQQQYPPQYSNQPQQMPTQSQANHPYGQPHMNNYGMYPPNVYGTNSQSGYGPPQGSPQPQSPSTHSVYAAQSPYSNVAPGSPVFSSQSVSNQGSSTGYGPPNSPVPNYGPPNSYSQQGGYPGQQVYGQPQPQQSNAYHSPHAVNSNYGQPNVQSSPYNGPVTNSQIPIANSQQPNPVPSPQSYSQPYAPPNAPQNPNVGPSPNPTYPPPHPTHPPPSHSPYDQQVSNTGYNYGPGPGPHTPQPNYGPQSQYGSPQAYQGYQRPSQPNPQSNPDQPLPPPSQYAYSYPQQV